jgi:transcriptional regulator with XRE-family HTH domain
VSPELFRRLLRTRGWETVEDFCRAARVRRRSIDRYIRHEHRPRPETLERLQAALGLDKRAAVELFGPPFPDEAP